MSVLYKRGLQIKPTTTYPNTSGVIYLTYLFPDLSSDEGRVDDNHVKGAMKVGRQILGLVEIVEDKAWVLIELLIELFLLFNSNAGLHQTP